MSHRPYDVVDAGRLSEQDLRVEGRSRRVGGLVNLGATASIDSTKVAGKSTVASVVGQILTR